MWSDGSIESPMRPIDEPSCESRFSSPYRGIVSVTGLAIAVTNKQGTTADLLVLREAVGLVGQYDTVRGRS